MRAIYSKLRFDWLIKRSAGHSRRWSDLGIGIDILNTKCENGCDKRVDAGRYSEPEP